MSVQYISDSTGKTTGVFIPITEWNKIKDEYKDIEQKQVDVPLWHIQEVNKRLDQYEQNPDIATDFDQDMKDIENEFDL